MLTSAAASFTVCVASAARNRPSRSSGSSLSGGPIKSVISPRAGSRDKHIREDTHFSAFHRLKSLRQFTRNSGASVPEHIERIRECFQQSMRCLMPNQRAGQSGTFGRPQPAERRPSRRLLRRRKTQEHEG